MVLLCVAEDRFIAGRQPVPIPNAECPQIDPAGAPVESHPVLRVRQFDKQLGVVLKPPGQEIFHREQCIQFAEIGEGNLDMKAIIEASVKGGAIYLPIEQDQTYGLDPFDCIRTSVKNIRDMGFGGYL